MKLRFGISTDFYIRNLKLPRIKKPRIPKIWLHGIRTPKITPLRFGGKRSKFGGGNDYYTKIFRS